MTASNEIRFDPDESLQLDSDYSLVLSDPLADCHGNTLPSPISSVFDTLGRLSGLTTADVGSSAAGMSFFGNAGAQAGTSVAGLGNVDADPDGIHDLIYGSPYDFGLASNSGTATPAFVTTGSRWPSPTTG